MSRFVSGGTNDAPTERDEAWLKAEQELEAKRLQKAELGKQQDGKSLYETLQANKAAKQDAFEESIRLRNQFQTLNEDEVEFLDSVLEESRKKDEAVRKQTREELNAFRRQQEEAGKVENKGGDGEVEEVSWKVGRKRKKGKEDVLGRVKLRKGSSAGDRKDGGNSAGADEKTKSEKGTAAPAEDQSKKEPAQVEELKDKKSEKDTEASKPLPKAAPAGLGLGVYSSDEDD